LYCVRSWPMRAVLVSLSPGISLPFRIGGKPATLNVIVLNLPEVWASAVHKNGIWSKRERMVVVVVEDTSCCLGGYPATSKYSRLWSTFIHKCLKNPGYVRCIEPGGGVQKRSCLTYCQANRRVVHGHGYSDLLEVYITAGIVRGHVTLVGRSSEIR
jgi:hypothetical protein